MSFLINPKNIKISDIKNKEYSLHPSEHKNVIIKNKNLVSIKDIVDFEDVGKQIDTSNYVNFTSDYYLGTISCMNNLIFDSKKSENITSLEFENSKKKLNKNDLVISRNATLGKISIIKDNVNLILNGGLSYLRINNELLRYYFMSFFIVDFGASILKLKTSGGGTQKNAKKEDLLNMKIPFPTKENNKNPEDVKQMVSLIVRNIIDKEEQIKLKNNEIDNLIEEELKNNQKNKNASYLYPKISEVKTNSRLDTGIYNKKFKENENLILNYSRGFVDLSNEKIITGRTPKDYYYTNVKQKNTYLWLTPKYIKNREIKSKIYLHTKYPTNLEQNDIIFTAIGTNAQGHMFLYTGEDKTYINQNTCAIRVNNKNICNIFTLCFLSSPISKKIIKEYTSNGSVPAIYSKDISMLKIPIFEKEYQNKMCN